MSTVQELLLRTGIDIIAALLLTGALFYRRYRNTQLFAASMILNLSVFAVMNVISGGNVGLQVGFGLFAILSIFRLRSENFATMDMAYFFGAISIAAVNGVATLGIPLLLANTVILGGAWLLDHERILGRTTRTIITLDRIPKHLLDPQRMRAQLSKEYGVTVVGHHIDEVDRVKDAVTLSMEYRRA